ncbi:MAG: hypothetical protein CM15mP74_04970 [Halieaceae bacterium]|nr:MAG: hypothetical protein CM15mP74_04970 [Halieaceae bacterium]
MLQYTGAPPAWPRARCYPRQSDRQRLQSDAFFETHDITGEGSTILQPLPVYHIYAFTASMYALRIGAHTAFVPNPAICPRWSRPSTSTGRRCSAV